MNREEKLKTSREKQLLCTHLRNFISPTITLLRAQLFQEPELLLQCVFFSHNY